MEPILTNALATIKSLAFGGFGLLEGSADEVFWFATGLAVFFTLVAYVMRPPASPLGMATPWTALLFTMYVVAVLMRDFLALTTVYIDFMSEAGIHAAGGGPQHGLEDVSAIVEAGWEAAKAVFAAMGNVSIYFNPGEFFLLVLCCIAIVGSHCFLAFRLIKLFGEFYILSVIAFFCLPFAVWQRTLFMAEGAARYIIATGLSIMAIGFGYGLTHAMVGDIVFDPGLILTDYFGQSVSMLILLLIVGGLPNGIRHMITGTSAGGFGNEARDLMFTATSAAAAARVAMAMAPAAGAATAAAGAAAGGGGGGGSSGGGGSGGLPPISFNPPPSGGGGGGGTARTTAMLLPNGKVRIP